jgi:ATP-binding cassette subfamily B (MDR/TAP) protein 1
MYAFLHDDIDEEIYMKQPEGFVVPNKEHLVCKLKYSMYDLKQPPRQWYKKFDTFMFSQSFDRNHADHCLYTRKDIDDSPIILYVDDKLNGKRKTSLDVLNDQLKSVLSMKNLVNANIFWP